MLLYSSLLTILLSLILAFFNYKENKSVIYLALFFTAFAGLGFMQYLITFKNITIGNYLAPLYLLPGPLLYIYAKSALKQKAISIKKTILHFLPVLTTLLAIPIYSLPVLKNTATPLSQATFLAGLTSMLVYGLIILARFINGRSNKKEVYQSPCLYLNKWILTLSALTSIIAFTFIVLFSLKQSNFLSKEYVLLTNLAVGLLLSTMSILLLLFPSILYGMSALPEKEKATTLIQHQGKPKKEISFSDQQLVLLANDIMAYLEKEKPFLNTEFSMSHLAVAFNVPQHHIANCFNQIIKKKFTSLRTEFRVNYAKELLANGLINTLSIDGIGAQAGFTTRSHFYASFKLIVGCSPLAYLEKQSVQVKSVEIKHQAQMA